MGIKNPEKFRWLFGDRTTKATVGWTFGALLFALASIGSSLERNRESANAVVTSSPVTVQEPPPSAPAKKTAAEMRADAAKERTARVQAKAQRELAEKVVEKKKAERERRANAEFAARQRTARRNAEAAPPTEQLSSESQPQVAPLPPRQSTTDTGLDWVDIPGVGRRQLGKFFGIEYVVLSVEKLASIEETKADDTFYLVNMMVANTKQQTEEVETEDIVLLDNTGRAFKRSQDGSYALESLDRARTVATYSVPVQPSLTKEFTLVFDAPSDANGLRIRIPLGFANPIAVPQPDG
jgi:hypothetical protein